MKNQGAGEEGGQEPHLCCLLLILGAWDRSDRKRVPPPEGFRAGEEGQGLDGGWVGVARTSLGDDVDKNNSIAATLSGGQAGKSLDFGAQLLDALGKGYLSLGLRVPICELGMVRVPI